MLELRDLGFVHKYFMAEKQESFLFLTLGILALIISVLFFFFSKTNPSFFKGAAIPLLAIGIIQLVVGYSVFAKSDKQRISIAYNLGIEPVNFVKNEELPRMERVMKNFTIYRYTEIALILTGLVLFLLFRSNPEKSFWYGIGFTLAIQATLMLAADYFAEKRAAVYTQELKKIIEE